MSQPDPSAPHPPLTVDELAKLTAEVNVASRPRSTPVTASFNRAMIDALREGRGQVSGELSTILLLILTTTGRRSGAARPCPVGYFVVDGRLLILASMGGSERNPDWYHNVCAEPRVHVELNGTRFAARALVTTGSDRDALFAEVCRRSPVFTEYQNRTARTIPVVELQALEVDLAAILTANPAALEASS